MINEKCQQSNYINIIQSPIKPMDMIPVYLYATTVLLCEVMTGVGLEYFFSKSGFISTIEYAMYIIMATITMQILVHSIILLVACFKQMYLLEIIANIVAQLMLILVVVCNYSLLLEIDSTSNYKYYPFIVAGIFAILQAKQIFKLKKSSDKLDELL
ncbi:hypothetical protein K6H10_004913 [Candida tropicalis]